MDLLIRRAQANDLKAVHELLCELEDRTFDLKDFAAVYSGNIESAHNIYLVAEYAGDVVGLLTCHGQTLLHHAGPVFEIQELIVGKEFRSMGIGKLLLGRLDKELSGIPHEILEVCSNVKRNRAHDFYLREGFTRSHYKFTKPR